MGTHEANAASAFMMAIWLSPAEVHPPNAIVDPSGARAAWK